MANFVFFGRQYTVESGGEVTLYEMAYNDDLFESFQWFMEKGVPIFLAPDLKLMLTNIEINGPSTDMFKTMNVKGTAL